MNLAALLRLCTAGVVIAAAAWSLLPVGVWFAGWDPAYFATTRAVWLDGGVVAVLLAAAALALTRWRAAGALESLWARLLAVPQWRFAGAAALVAAALAVIAAVVLFDGNPRNVDGFAQLFQARIFQAGRLWIEAPPPAETANFATLQMIVGPERWYAQYPPGQSLVLAIGLLGGAWWLLNPLFAALLAVSTWRVARWCAGESEARLAVLLLVVSPFVLAMAGSEMSHLAAAAIGMAAAACATFAAGRAVPAAAGAGLLLGAMASFRPMDAVAAAVPVALILVVAAPRLVPALAAAGAAGAIASLPTLAFNRATTGGWLEFGYTRLWGPQHSLGFHDVPWGTPLTPVRAVGLTGVDLHQLNGYLLDWPFPVLAVAALGFAFAVKKLTGRDAIAVAGAASLFALLFFYWHRDVFYGPRLHFSAVPWVVVVAARGMVLLAGWGSARGAAAPGRIAATILAAGALVGVVMLTPSRLAAYRDSAPLFRLHPDRDAERVGIGNALVLIPDGWGTRLIARMWSLGVPVWRSSRLYAALDACTLHETLAAAESDEAHRAGLLSRLDSLAAAGRPGARGDRSPDRNLRLPPDSLLTPGCRAELEFDRGGFLSYAPYLYLNNATLDGDIVWARDMGSGNAALLARYSGRRVYRWAPRAPDGAPVFTPLETSAPGPQ